MIASIGPTRRARSRRVSAATPRRPSTTRTTLPCGLSRSSRPRTAPPSSSPTWPPVMSWRSAPASRDSSSTARRSAWRRSGSSTTREASTSRFAMRRAGARPTERGGICSTPPREPTSAQRGARRPRFQLRVPAVVQLRPAVELSAPAARELAFHPDPWGRAVPGLIRSRLPAPEPSRPPTSTPEPVGRAPTPGRA